jgi:hypothetical protein
MTEMHRERAIDVIRTTSDMFKTVSNDRETTATLQADFLTSLFEHRDRQPATEQAPGVWPTMSQNSEHWTSGDIHGTDHTNTSTQAPFIDVTDFDSWLSSFDMGSLADPQLGTSWSGLDGQAVPASSGPVPISTSNTDWDAVSLRASLG